MVDLQNLKNAIMEGGFSEEAKILMLSIVDAAIGRGSLSAAEKKKLQDIMDVEIDSNNLEQSAHEEAAEMIETLLAEAEAAGVTASDNIEALEKEAKDASQKIQDDLASGQQTSTPPAVSQPESVVPQAATQVPVQPETPPWQPPQ